MTRRVRTIAAALAATLAATGVALPAAPDASRAATSDAPAPTTAPAPPAPATAPGPAAAPDAPQASEPLPPAPSQSVGQMAWLAGCWESRDERDHTEEQWMAPEGRSMIGMSRTVRNGRTIAWEQLRIDEREGRLILTAHPSSQSEASFLLVRLDDASAVFENPEHDYPQRVIYRRTAEGSLAGRIEGTDKGTSRAIDFPMKRVACPNQPGAAGRP